MQGIKVNAEPQNGVSIEEVMCCAIEIPQDIANIILSELDPVDLRAVENSPITIATGVHPHLGCVSMIHSSLGASLATMDFHRDLTLA